MAAPPVHHDGGAAARQGAPVALGLVVLGLACQEIGASIAVLLFPHAGPLGIVMLRLVFSALVLLAIARPSLRGRSRADWAAVVRFGAVLALMNGTFYLALERLDLGVTVTIEVLGPLALSVALARGRGAWVWAGLALAGVAALGAGGWGELDPVGVAFALVAAVSWAGYIRGSAAVGRAFPRLDGLALAMAVGAVLALPFGIVDAGAALLDPSLLALGAAVALLSSTIPYAAELAALRRLSESAFGVLMSLGPATAALAGFLILGQRLEWLEIAGIALVVVASAGAVWAARARDDRAPTVEPVA